MNESQNYTSRDPVLIYTFIQLETILGCLRIIWLYGRKERLDDWEFFNTEAAALLNCLMLLIFHLQVF
jgi:sulfur transfer protein SufE